MDTSQDTPVHWTSRLPAQIAALLAILCATVAFFWNHGLSSFLLSLVGVGFAVAMTQLTVAGWLLGEEKE